MEKIFNPSLCDFEEMQKQLGITLYNWRQRLLELPMAVINVNEKQQAFNWCKENFNLSWIYERIGDGCVFYFKDESQLLQFTLRFETLAT